MFESISRYESASNKYNLIKIWGSLDHLGSIQDDSLAQKFIDQLTCIDSERNYCKRKKWEAIYGGPSDRTESNQNNKVKTNVNKKQTNRLIIIEIKQ